MDFDKMSECANESLNEDLSKSKELSSSSVNNLVDLFNQHFTEIGLIDWVGSIVNPASIGAITNAEDRMGIKFTKDTKLFFLESNGIDNKGGDCPFSVFSIDCLKRGLNHKERISDKVIKIQKKYGQVVGGEICVTEINNVDDIFNRAAGKIDTSISIEDADKLILLSSNPNKIQTVGLCVDNIKNLNIGCVVDIEGSNATKYSNIKEWLASFNTFIS